MLTNKYLSIVLLYFLFGMDGVAIGATKLSLPLFEWCEGKIEARRSDSIILEKTKIKYKYFSDVGEFKSSIVGVMEVSIDSDDKFKEIAINTIKYLCLPSSSTVADFSSRGLSVVLQYLHAQGKNNHVYFDMLNRKIYVQSTPD